MDGDLAGDTEATVEVISPSGDSEQILLSSVPGIGPPFRNSTVLTTAIDTGSPIPNDGILTTDGDTITVRYLDLAPAAWRTDEATLNPGGSPTMSYEVNDAAPDTPGEINTAYCVDETITVPFNNTSPDTAYNVRYEITLPAGYEIDTPSINSGAIPSDTSGAYPSYHQLGNTVYLYLREEMAGSTPDTLTFTFKKKAAPDGCGASLTGTVGFTLFYQDVCGGITTSNNNQTLTVADGVFTLSVDKAGALEVVENDIAPFYVSFTYTGPLSCAGSSINVVAVDILPYILDVADSGNASTVETALDDDGNTIYVIKWNITIDTSPYDWSDTVYLRGRVSECGKEAYNLFNVSYTDCCGCAHVPGGFATFFLANKCPPRPEQGGCVSMFEKAALPTNAVESCKPAFFTHEIHFPDTMPATVSWDELTFREQGRRGMVLIGDTADFWVKDCGDTVTQSISGTAPDGSGTWYTWNLGFLSTADTCAPNTWPGGKTLFISYYGYFPAKGTFFDWSELIVNDTADTCFGDPAGNCCNDTYQEPQWMTIDYPTLDLAVSGPYLVDKCDTEGSFTLTLSGSGSYPVYDVRVNFYFPDASYDYVSNSTTFSGIFDEDSIAIGAREPDSNFVDGSWRVLRWDLGDIRHQGEIALNLFKNCGTSLQVKADGSYDTYCNDGEPDNFTDNIIALPEDLYTPGLRSPNLTITKTPDPFLVKNNQTITWTIQIDNNGSAPAVRTIVADTLPLYVNFFSASDTPIQEPAVGTTGMVEWVINDPIQPGGFKKLTLVGVVTCAPGDTLPGDNEVKLWTGCPDLQDTTALICVRQQASDTAGHLWHAGQSGGGGSHEISQQVPGVIKYCEQEKIIITLSNTGLIDITSPIHIYQDLDARLRYVSSTVTHSDSASFHSKVNRPDIVNLGPIATKTVERIIVTDTLPSYAYFAEANPMPDYPPSPGDTPGVTLIWVFDGSDASINVGGHTPISLKANIICPSDSTAFLDVNAATVQAGLGDNPDTIPAAGSTGLLEFGYTTTDLNPGETLTLYITVSSDCAFIGPDTNTVSISGATCWGERYILTNGEHEEGITGTTDRPLRIQAP